MLFLLPKPPVVHITTELEVSSIYIRLEDTETKHLITESKQINHTQKFVVNIKCKSNLAQCLFKIHCAKVSVQKDYVNGH